MVNTRLTYDDLNKIKEKYGVNVLWSFSRLRCYENSPFNYYLKYIKKVKELDKSTIYTESGTTVHECLEKFYNGEIKYEDMLSLYNDRLDIFEITDLKYNKTDEERNATIANKYEADIKHFFANHVKFKYKKCETERFMITKVKDHVFQGYCDFLYQGLDDILYIVDFKSSTIYQGHKILDEGKQLLLYAQSLIQMGIPIDKIKICWDFLKYTKVTYKLKNGNITERKIKRSELGDKLKASAKTKLKDAKYSPDEIEAYLGNLVTKNDVKELPDEISSQYTLEDCLVYIPLTNEILDNLNNEIDEVIKEIDAKTQKAEELKADNISENIIEELFWDSDESLKKNEYFFMNLCGYTREQHKPWDRYLKKKENLVKQKDNMLYTEQDAEDEASLDDDMSWLDSLING